jgi:hypothetical protein
MNRWRSAVATASISLLLMNLPLIAQGKSGGSNQKPQAPKHPTSQSTKSQAPTQSTKSHAPKTTHAAKSPASKATPTSNPTTTASASKPKSVKSSDASSTSKSKTSTTAAPTQPSSTVTLSPAQQKLQRNTNLASKLQSRLPAGTDLMKAAAGFKNLGQFVAAVNVSKNLDIPFTRLRSRMVDDQMSLGQAIQSEKRSAYGAMEAQRAENDARIMIAESEQTPTTTTVAATAKSKKTKPTSGGGSDE